MLAAHPWAAVALLMLVTILNNMDRFLPSILAEPMKRELGLSDTFLGVLNGIGFLVIYAVAGIPIARFADRGRFGAVISASLAGWSLMTALGGLVTSGWQLAATRAGVALGEAGSTPAAHAYISRNFPPEQRPGALALLTLGAPLGMMASLVVGGVVGELLGWRRTFMVMGGLGLILAPIVLIALGRGQPLPSRAADPATADLRSILRKPSVLALCAASGFIALGGYASGAFSPAFLIRAHGMSVGTVGLQLGLLNGGLGVLAMLAMSWLGGRLARRDPRWPLALLTLLALVAIPFGVAGYLFAEGTGAVLCIAISNLVGGAYLALTVACLHSLAPVTVRARISAVLLFCTAMMGGLGPLFAGMISDVLTPTYGVEALGRALLIVPASLVLAAACFIAAAANFRRDMVEERVTD
ncbi:MFS transporter [Phenylobacterium sp. LjRoot225]|uniref:spinster family MFS transporter n=1 Tax=Phenylobacterium sp. LjRoot225 TaxID=3342285 RepID=UPI003ECDA577